MTLAIAERIHVHKINENDPKRVLRKHLPDLAVSMEHITYWHLSDIVEDYRGEHLEIFELSNNGLYMAPASPEVLMTRSRRTVFWGKLSPGAVGIIATMMTLDYLEQMTPSERVREYQEHLREFIPLHPESAAICAALG